MAEKTRRQFIKGMGTAALSAAAISGLSSLPSFAGSDDKSEADEISIDESICKGDARLIFSCSGAADVGEIASPRQHIEASPPKHTSQKMGQGFYYPDKPVVYNAPDYRHLFPPERIEIIDKVIQQADAVFARLFTDKDGLILIHGDLHFWNVHLHCGELYVIDFEDVNLGFPVQDIAVTLSYGRERDGYQEWRDTFKQGYSSARRWPAESERTIEILMAARIVMFINYVARIDPAPQEYIERRSKDLERFLDAHC